MGRAQDASTDQAIQIPIAFLERSNTIVHSELPSSLCERAITDAEEREVYGTV